MINWAGERVNMDRYLSLAIAGAAPGAIVRLEGREADHLRVKRPERGARVRLFDGRGAEALAEVVEPPLGGAPALLRVLEEREAGEGAVPVTLLVAIPKGKRDLVLVEKATELGVASLRPLVTRRTVGAARHAGDSARPEKWRRTAVEAAKQCGLGRLPEIGAALPLDEALRLYGASGEETTRGARPGPPQDGSSVSECGPPRALRLLLHPREDARPLRERLAGPRPDSVTALVGPEGGFTDEEASAARTAGFEAVRLGRTVLRIETAAIALLAALVAAWD
jgi:16S rRNA (uracil1498-N3)-methyltransferase